MTQQQRIIYVRALDCEIAPDNIRTVSDPLADAQLEANIGETGMIIQNLIGLEIKRRKGRFHIYGGGRRLARVHANIASGTLPEDYMVPVLPAKDRKQALSMSLDENFYKQSMNPADECRAFQAVMDAEKKTPAEIAKQRGLTEKFVKGRLRLANLAPAVFEALRLSDITLDIAQAYGSVADPDRQAKVFEQLSGTHQSDNANEIRRQLAVGSLRGGDPKALLAGRDAYLAAGGRIESDLFSDQSTELWLDGDIIERLVEDRLTTAADDIRAREGFAEVRILPSTVMPYDATVGLAEILPQPLEITPETAARQSEIDARLAEFTRIAEETDGCTDEQILEAQALQQEHARLGIVETGFTPEQKAGAIAYVMIDREGRPRLYEEIFSPLVATEPAGDRVDEDDLDGDDAVGDLLGDDEDGAPGEDGGGDDDKGTILPPAAPVETQEPDEEAEGDVTIRYTGRLRDEMAVIRGNLLALHIANDPQFALDLGTFIMVDGVCHESWNGMPSDLRLKAPSARAPGFVDTSLAAQSWAKLDAALDRSWLGHKAIEDRYDAFCALDDGARAAWLGWAVARSLQAVPEGMSGFGFLGHLGGKLEIDVAAWWRPDARSFFDGLTRSTMLALFEGIGGLDLRSRYTSAKRHELATACEKLFAGEAFVDPEVSARAVRWVPEPMRFAEATVPVVQAPVEEAPGEAGEPVIEANDAIGIADLPEAA